MEYVVRLQFQTINNEEKYEALLQGLELAKSLGADSVIVQGDLQLVIGQVMERVKLRKNRRRDTWTKLNNELKVS